MENVNTNQSEFWKSIDKVGISTNKNIPMEVVLDDGSISSDTEIVLINGRPILANTIIHRMAILLTIVTGRINMPKMSPCLMTTLQFSKYKVSPRSKGAQGVWI